jgi:hypothetical protein
MPKNPGGILSRDCASAKRLPGLAAIIGAALLLGGMARASDLPAEEAIDWAKEQQFWSFQEPHAQARPNVKNRRWPQQPLDYFILARLEQKGLSPNPAAERHALIRRVTFDLTGLPPTPREVEDFVQDRRRDAYERLVDRLLASMRFGEHMASLWLPLARYAEDQAHQVGDDTKFFYPNAYKYREWVINAFNRDLPYDQFIKLQLAADKIEGTNSANLPALGFLGLGPKYYNRGRLEVMADEWEDRVDTLSRTMLGLTVACARCHDHKFDPITMQDYYALAGVFASTKMINKKSDGKEEKAEKAEKMDPNAVHVVEDGEAKNLNIFPQHFSPGRRGAQRARSGAAFPASLVERTGALHGRQRTQGIGRMRCQPGQSFDGPRDGQSALGRFLWPALGDNAEQFWALWPAAQSSAVAG